MMVTTGSRVFYGAGIAGILGAIVYGILTGAADHGGVLNVLSGADVVNTVVGPLSVGWKGWVGDHVGYTMFLGFGALSLTLGGLCSAFRDADPEALAELSGSGAVPPVVEPKGLSAWPVAGAFFAGLTVIGLANTPALTIVGGIGLLAVAFEWTVSAWAERATGDAEENRRLRNRIMLPIEVPVIGALVVAFVGFGFSRGLLAASKLGAALLAVGVATVVLAIAFFLASRPHLRRNAMVGVAVGVAVVVLGIAIAGALVGPRDIEPHGAGHGGGEEHGAAVVTEADSADTSFGRDTGRAI